MTTTTFHGTGSQSEQFSLKWNNFHSNLSSGFHDLLEEEDLVDVTLACEGQFVQAHKIVLSVCSPYFKNLFKINPCKHPIVILKDVRHRDLQSIIQFMYLGVTNVRQDELSTFLKTAESLKIKGLTEDEKNQAGRRQTSSKSNGNENQQADEIHEPVVNISTPKVPLEIRGASTPPPAKRRTRTAPQPVPAPVMTITEEPQSVDSPGASVDSARSNAGSELTFEMVPTNRPKLEPVDVEMNSEGFEAHYLEKSGRDDIEPEEQELSSDMLSDSELNASDLGLKISQARGNVLHGQAGPSTSFDSGLTVHPIGGDSAEDIDEQALLLTPDLLAFRCLEDDKQYLRDTSPDPAWAPLTNKRHTGTRSKRSSIPISRHTRDSVTHISFQEERRSATLNVWKEASFLAFEMPELFSGKPINLLQKRRLNRVVVDAFLKMIHPRHPTTDEKEMLAIKIVETFQQLQSPGINPHAQWFLRGKKGKCATGLVEERIKNKFRNRGRKGLVRICDKSDERNTPFDNAVSDLITQKELQGMKYWLQYNDTPEEKVIDYLAKTRKYRIEFSNSITVDDYFKEWPLLAKYNVITKEFDSLYKENNMGSLVSDFKGIVPNLIIAAKNYGPVSVEKEAQKLSSLADTEEKEMNAALHLLHLMLPQGSLAGKKGKPNAHVTKLHFLVKLEDENNLTSFLSNDKVRCLDSLSRTQPFIVYNGPDLQPTSVHVVVSNTAITCSSLIQAVETCFKIYYITQLKYPNECANVWLFIESLFKKKKENHPACVTELRSCLYPKQ